MPISNVFPRLLPINFLLVAAALPAVAFGEREEKTVREATRVSPPERWDDETERLFEGDPSRRLKGSRPARRQAKRSQETALAGAHETSANSEKTLWRELISAATVEDEIKTLYPEIEKNVRRVGLYKSGGHQNVEQQFALLAILFGILAEHDQAQRWRMVAAGARDHFSSGSRNAKVSSMQAFKDSQSRSEVLGQLVRGEKVAWDPPRSEVFWSQVADRHLLMQRLDQGYETRLRIWSANRKEFDSNRLSIIHEAEIVSALARIIQQPEHEFYDDDEYLAHCRQLESAARQVAAAAEESNLEQVQKHLGAMNKACSRCHEGYK